MSNPRKLCGRLFGGLVLFIGLNSTLALRISSRVTHGGSARLPHRKSKHRGHYRPRPRPAQAHSEPFHHARRSTSMVLSSCCIAANFFISSRLAAVSASGASACRPRKNSPSRLNPYSRLPPSRDSVNPSVHSTRLSPESSRTFCVG